MRNLFLNLKNKSEKSKESTHKYKINKRLYLLIFIL